MKRFLSFASAFLLILLIAPLTLLPASAATIASGTCGDNLTWALEDGTLTISGTGEMEGVWDSGNQRFAYGWTMHASEITAVVIEEGPQV